MPRCTLDGWPAAEQPRKTGPQPPPGGADTGATALYQGHALGLIRFAYLMLGVWRAGGGGRLVRSAGARGGAGRWWGRGALP